MRPKLRRMGFWNTRQQRSKMQNEVMHSSGMAKAHLYSLCHFWWNLRRLSDRHTAISYQASLIITAASQYSDTVSKMESLCIRESHRNERTKRY